jgi:hypothetical protein
MQVEQLRAPLASFQATIMLADHAEANYFLRLSHFSYIQLTVGSWSGIFH